MICIRSVMVWARNSVSSRIDPSGQNVTVVPVRGSPVDRSIGEGPVAAILRFTFPPFSNSASQRCPSRSISRINRVESAFTTEIPDAVESPGDLVTLPAELAAGVQRGENDFGRRHLRVLRMRPDGNSRAVVSHPAPSVGQQRHIDPRGPARHGFVDRVVDHFPHQVVQSRRPGRADVHPRTLAHGLESFEDRDITLAVGTVLRSCNSINLYRHRRALSKRQFSRCGSNPRTMVPGIPHPNASSYPTAVSFRHVSTTSRRVATTVGPPLLSAR